MFKVFVGGLGDVSGYVVFLCALEVSVLMLWWCWS